MLFTLSFKHKVVAVPSTVSYYIYILLYICECSKANNIVKNGIDKGKSRNVFRVCFFFLKVK